MARKQVDPAGVSVYELGDRLAFNYNFRHKGRYKGSTKQLTRSSRPVAPAISGQKYPTAARRRQRCLPPPCAAPQAGAGPRRGRRR